jgi:photosystem II stability/assembly factor-like uncharacterized protein
MNSLVRQNRKTIILFITTLLLGACSSEPTAPTEVKLEVHSLAIGSSNQLLITTQEGLIRSLDNGETWESINSTLNLKGLVAVSPSGTIYCMRLESNGLYNHTETLYRSTNAGITFLSTGWNKKNISLGMLRLTFNKQEHLFAAEGFPGTIYRSTSQGEDWESLGSGSILPLIAPDNIFGTSSDGVYRSNDNGDNWIKVLELLDITGDTTYSYGNLFSNPLAFYSQGRIFAAINATSLGDSVEIGLVYHSDDNGNNWIKSIVTNSHITHLAVNSEDKIFAVTKLNEIHCSMDNGIQWIKVNVNAPEGWILQFIVSPNKKIFVRTDGPQLYRSQDEGVTWTQIQPHL